MIFTFLDKGTIHHGLNVHHLFQDPLEQFSSLTVDKQNQVIVHYVLRSVQQFIHHSPL